MFLNKALKAFVVLKDDEEQANVQGSIIADFVEQKKYAQANKVFIDAMHKHPKMARSLRGCYRTCLKREAFTNANIFPRVHKLLKESKFTELEKYAEQEIPGKNIFPSGTWYLDAFSNQLDNTLYLDQLRQWVKEHPQSSTAKIALATALQSYAWDARGSGWASTVTDKGWKLMRERLADAAHQLDQCKEKTPLWYTASQRVALGQSWPKDKYDALVNESISKYPNHDAAIFQALWWLQPRWFGEEGDAEKFLDSQVSKRPNPDGEILYARSAWWLDGIMGDAINDTKLSWPKTKAGFTALMKKYPDAASVRGEYSILALEAKDEAAAATAFSK